MTETLTLTGANELAAKIRKYWAAQGKTVNTRVEEFRAPSGKDGGNLKGALYAVRSDMVGGQPTS